MIGLPKMDGCASLLDVNLEECKALTADGLEEFCAHPPPALQKLNLSFTNLKSKCRRLHVVPMLHLLIHRSIRLLVDRDILKAQLPKCVITF